MNLVDSRGLVALKKIGMDKAAIALAEAAHEAGAAEAASTMRFLKEDEDADGRFMAELTIKVVRV